MSEKICIITGSGSGLGRATAIELDKAGYQCVLVGRRIEALHSTLKINSFIKEPLCIQGDISQSEDRTRIVETSIENFGRIDVLVNNAGVSDQQPILNYSEESWLKVMSTNVNAMFFLSQLVLPGMIKNRFGRIINIGSIYGSLALNSALYPGFFSEDMPGNPTRQPAYHTSKGAVLNLTRDLAAAVAPFGITVNTISPGMFQTEQSEGIISDEVINSLSRMTPVGRFGEPSEIGYAVTFLASEKSAFITGAELVVDGGWSIW